jgi:DNA recombination-dependent growth factor C
MTLVCKSITSRNIHSSEIDTERPIMSLTSNSASITRFRVFGQLDKPLETVLSGLEKFSIDRQTPEDDDDQRFGWTSAQSPYTPDFESSFTIGSLFVFSFRIDKKTVPGKLVQQKINDTLKRRMAERQDQPLSRAETREITAQVKKMLISQAPFVPNIYDLFWDYESSTVYLLSNSRAVCEKLEDLFNKSFGLRLVQLFAFTIADLTFDLTDAQRKDLLAQQPTFFTE